MYTVDDLDGVIEREDLPPPCSGAPVPRLIADDHHACLSYNVSDPSWIAEGRQNQGLGLPDGRPSDCVAFVRLSADSLMYGFPNDEAMGGHPLADRGYDGYAVYEVLNSSWIRHLDQIEREGYSGKPILLFGRASHLIFGFHDSTFECVCREPSFTLKICGEETGLDRHAELARLFEENNQK